MAFNCNEDQRSVLTDDDYSDDEIFFGPKMTLTDDDYSDDEIFFGPKMTLKEVKKRLLPDNYRQTVECVVPTALDGGPEGNKYESFQNKEMHSDPNVLAKNNILSPTIPKSLQRPSLTGVQLAQSALESGDSKALSNWDLEADDSFLKLEQMVANLNVTPAIQIDCVENISETKGCSQEQLDLETSETNIQLQDTRNTVHDNEKALYLQEEVLDYKTPLKNNYTSTLAVHKTRNIDIFTTPSSELKTRSLFKTPGNLTHKKLIIPSQKYQHVVSPVAAYIKQSPQVPLLKNVCPKKTLPGVSSIPKSVKYLGLDKENMKEGIQEKVKLPAVAYKSAKETKMINIPDDGKMPQKQWAKHVASSIPKAIVIKHNHREVNSVKKPLLQKQEDSFADLSLHQADLSVCTQKSALNKLK